MRTFKKGILLMTEAAKEVKTFSIYYDAADSELSKHSISAKTLGKSVSALSAMIEQADLLLNNQQTTVELQVSAPAVAGSFGIDFSLINLLPDTTNILEYLGFAACGTAITGGSALAIAQKIKDRTVLNIITDSDSTDVKLELDGETIDCDQKVASLVTDPIIRHAIKTVIVDPLSGQASPSFKVKVNNQDIFSTSDEADLSFFDLPKDSLLTERTETVRTNIYFSRVNFISSSGWKMVYDGAERAVVMQDENFMLKVKNSKEKFSKNDMFEVDLEIINRDTARGFKTRFIIKEVLRHRTRRKSRLV